MKTYCLVCKKYTNNSSLRVVNDKKKLMFSINLRCQIVRCAEIKATCLLQRGLVYLIV